MYTTIERGWCPALQLNLESIISTRSVSPELFKIEEVKDKKGNIIHHTIEFGEYPQHRADNKQELDVAYHNGFMQATGKEYTGYREDDGSFVKNKEFTYKGKKYVRTKVSIADDDSEYLDGKKAKTSDKYEWVEVEPIKWIIRNWDEMPRSINPKGNGRTTSIKVRSKDALISGIPFNPKYGKMEDTMWQNSMTRAYFNGYDLKKEIMLKGNGNGGYVQNEMYNFENQGFLQEALDIEINKKTVISNNTVNNTVNKNDQSSNVLEPGERKSRLEKLNPDNSPREFRRRMTDTEMVKTWIDAGQSVLLRGPSGIGKTERIKKLYPNLIYIKLTNNMFPEKVVGSMNLQTGQSIPPDFAKQVILENANEEERKLINENIQNLYDLADVIYERSKNSNEKTVILLDELLNVKPAVQSLVYTLVLNKIVETGKGLKLPANTVVVATGNQKKYSSVAEDLAEPLEKRFDHILDMNPKVGEWIYEYAIPNKIHPSVMGYIFTKYQEKNKSEKIENISYFYEEPEVGEQKLDQYGCRGRTNDPRGWVSISNTLYAFEEDLKKGKFKGKNVEVLLKTTLNTKLRKEWADGFFDFYNNPTLTVEEIVEKKYTQADLPRNINEKFACISGLLNADEKQVGACRDFIRKYCDPEYLSVYDLYWAGNDEKRMEIIAELEMTDPSAIEESVINKNNANVIKPKREYEITIDEFFEGSKLVIHAPTEEKANVLMKVFDKMGKHWVTGNRFIKYNNWKQHLGNTCYTNDGCYSDKEHYKTEGYTVYSLDEVDMEKYLDDEDRKILGLDEEVEYEY